MYRIMSPMRSSRGCAKSRCQVTIFRPFANSGLRQYQPGTWESTCALQARKLVTAAVRS